MCLSKYQLEVGLFEELNYFKLEWCARKMPGTHPTCTQSVRNRSHIKGFILAERNVENAEMTDVNTHGAIDV